MTPITFWFDPISPYAYLAFERLPDAVEGHSVVVDYRPVVFGALLKHHAHKGPAEIEPKRQWTFRQVAWLAHSWQIPLDLPAQHPFNSLALLRRLLHAPGSDVTAGTCSRRAAEAVLHHVWRGGADPLDAHRLQALDAELGLTSEPGTAAKEALRRNTDLALEKGIFGVPSWECGSCVFWGLDALPMLSAQLQGDPWFATHWDHAARKVPGITRSV